MKINTLTTAEEQLMQVMWKLESAYLKEIMAAYPEPKPHQNTVSTFVKILVEKEFLNVEKEGRIFKYTVAIPKDDFRMFLVSRILEDYFDNSAEKLTESLKDAGLLTLENDELPLATKQKKTPKSQRNEVIEFVEEITSAKKAKKNKKKKKKAK